MAVYLTKSMLTNLNRVQYPSNFSNDEEGSSSSGGDQWQRFYSEGKSAADLAKDAICRVCARVACTPLSEKIEGYDIMSAICSITNVAISAEDSLPKYICNECLETLRVALIFKKTCETSDRKFKRILNPMGDPSYHSYPYSKHDFQLILHHMKLKRMRIEEEKEKERQRREKMLLKKTPKSKQFTCSPCDMNFPSKEKLLAHRRERQCMRRACELCGQLVLSITQHMRHIHKQSVLHKCPTCGKEFTVVARLRNHMLIHTNIFNFFCDLCPYKCKHKYYLVMHMRTHTGEKPYKCPECPATFVNPSNLNKHKLTHQEKQFKCFLCEKAFRTTSALREHREAAHMNIKHTCNYCGRDFCYKSDLRKHEIRSHNRTKRDYIGGEPTYKQVERMQKMKEENHDLDKWRHEIAVTQPTQIVQTAYMEPNKDYMSNSHQIYCFSDVTAVMHSQSQPMVQQQQQTVQLSLPELS
ncbi:zinc finger protein 578-like isoform X2 [Hyposmocoma kahamanoa]|uniref:zinc finger protein 578-like isoform X2 n=1 Tax=Hyposmocoma kahamanoa TaxID=1477025 RepID=UPI000E6D6DCA|nr:zinc finger protein 578-like isoform X2 [Hyposmocoma kahamanoa]